MRPVKAISQGFARYFSFSGRTRRTDFWWWFLFLLLMLYAGTFVDNEYINPALDFLPGEDGAPDYCVYTILALLALPTIAMAVRRAHDTDRKGWWALAIFPLFLKGQKNDNRFGPKP